MLYCWLSTFSTVCSTGFSALNLLLRKLPRNRPATWLLPDFVMALTWTPVDRPIVASKRLATNWNSAIESWLNFAWPPVPMSAETCWPSTFNWNSRASPPFRSGSGVCAAVPLAKGSVRLPGATSASAIQLRPLTGSSWTCFGSTLPPMLEFFRSMSGASPVMVTVSWMVEGAICMFKLAVCPTSRLTPDRIAVENPWSSEVT